MPGLFVGFLNRMRISFCAKRVCGEIQILTESQGARLALIAALYRGQMLDIPVPGGTATISEIIQHPRAYRKELCYTAFRLLWDMRQISREETKSYAEFKISPNPKVKEHTEICDLAFSLLMSTVGVGYHPPILTAVCFSWQQLSTYIPTESDIELVMKMPEYIVQDIIVQPLETGEWLALARKTPDFLDRSG